MTPEELTTIYEESRSCSCQKCQQLRRVIEYARGLERALAEASLFFDERFEEPDIQPIPRFDTLQTKETA